MFIFAHTTSGVPVYGFNFGLQNILKTESKSILIIGGVHGDEPEGPSAAWGLIEALQQPGQSVQDALQNLKITVVPQLNQDGVFLKTRTNFNGVDLNRNLPTKDWSPIAAQPRYSPGPSPGSEIENQALMTYLEKQKPNLIISLHSWNPMLNTNGDCEGIAHEIAKHTGYKVEPDIGYPTPGSLGTYAGKERGIPTLTYEIQRDIAFSEVIKVHVPAVIAGLIYFANQK